MSSEPTRIDRLKELEVQHGTEIERLEAALKRKGTEAEAATSQARASDPNPRQKVSPDALMGQAKTNSAALDEGRLAMDTGGALLREAKKELEVFKAEPRTPTPDPRAMHWRNASSRPRGMRRSGSPSTNRLRRARRRALPGS